LDSAGSGRKAIETKTLFRSDEVEEDNNERAQQGENWMQLK
jgi:hypothetical protein